MSNSLAHKEKRRLRARAKARENNLNRPKRKSVEERN